MNKITRRLGLSVGVSAIALMAFGMSAHAQDAQAQDSQTQTDKDASSSDVQPKKADDSQLVIVTARRKALRDAIEIKKNSDTIVDSIVADQAGQLPDSSVTEVLQRVSGVTLSRFQGVGGASSGSASYQIEGTGVTVRGLPYNSGTLNGRQAFSANGASALSWGDVTPELMGGVDVYKAARADQIEGGTSSIDLRTRMPFDYKKPEFDLSLGASYGDMIGKGSPSISALYTRRFDTKLGEMGFLVDGAFDRYYAENSDAQMGPYRMENDPNLASGQALVPTGYGWSQAAYKRDRSGLYAAFQWRPNDSLTLNSTFFFSQYKNENTSHSGNWGVNASGTVENIPTDATFDSSDAMQSGSIYVGATGANKLIFGANNFLAEDYNPNDPSYSWIGAYLGPNYQSLLTADCRSQYGSTSSSAPLINWGLWGQPGMFYCQNSGAANNHIGLNLGSNTSYGNGASSTMDFSQSFVWTPNASLRVRGAVQYVLSISKSLSMYAGITQGDPNLYSASFDLRKDIPVLGGFDAQALLNTNTAYFSQFSYNGQDNRGMMGAANIDADYNFSGDHFIKSVSFGARAADRRERDDFIGSYWAPISESWVPYYAYLNGANPQLVQPSDYQTYSFKNFFGGKDSPGTVLVPSDNLLHSFNWQRLASFSQEVSSGSMTTQQFYDKYFAATPGLTDSFIQNRAVYAEAKFAGNGFGFLPSFSGNFGVRVVQEVLSSKGYFVSTVGNKFYLDQGTATIVAFSPTPTPQNDDYYQGTTSYSLRTRNYGYVRVLPAFNVKFDVTPKFIVRLAASKGMSPPNFNDIKAGGSATANLIPVTAQTGQTYYLSNFTSYSGANMKPVMIDSADVSFEWYPKDGVYAYFDMFAKQLRDQDLFTNFYQTQPTPLLHGPDQTPVTLDLPWFYTQNESVSKPAQINGFETGGRKFFDNLPGVFKGLGVNGSVTYVESRNPALFANSVVGPYVPGSQTQSPTTPANNTTDFKTLPYYGMSKWSYNLELYYNRGPLNARLAYNWHSKQLLSTNINPLSFNTSGGNAYTCTSCLNNGANGLVWQAVPLWSDAAGYLDFSIDYKLTDHVSMGLQANNLLNTLSKTSQEVLPGVFERYDTYMSDRRLNAYLRMHF